MQHMITWLNKYASAVQALAAVVSVVLATVTVIVALLAHKRSVKNQEDILIHSSPKPLLELVKIQIGVPWVGYAEFPGRKTKYILADGEAPCIVLRNLGPGVAIKVRVYANVIVSGEEKTEEFVGPNLIPVTPDGDGNQLPKFSFTDSSALLPKKMVVTLHYESDSGFKRETIWRFAQTEEGEESYLLLKSS